MRFLTHASSRLLRTGKGGSCAQPDGCQVKRKGVHVFWTTVPELAREGHISVDRLYELARREEDPLPLRFVGEGARYGQVLCSEMAEWVKRNSVLYRDRNAKNG